MVHRGFTYFLVWLIQSPDTPPGSCSKIPSQQWRSVQWNKIHKRPYLPQLVKQDPKVFLPQAFLKILFVVRINWILHGCTACIFFSMVSTGPASPLTLSEKRGVIHVCLMLLLSVTHTNTHFLFSMPLCCWTCLLHVPVQPTRYL